MRMALRISDMYDYTTKIYRKQAEVVQNHLNANVRATGRGETTRRKHKKLNLEVVRPTTAQAVKRLRHDLL
jgi:hypothetical protein